MTAIYFDMDGTIANLYGSENWLSDLINGYTRPYREAKSLLDMRKLGKILNRLQSKGCHIGVVSWLAKRGTDEYNARVTATKLRWLARHIGAVQWDEIQIVPYGTPKSTVVQYPEGILFDDEERNRTEWMRAGEAAGLAYDVHEILEVLANFEKEVDALREIQELWGN